MTITKNTYYVVVSYFHNEETGDDFVADYIPYEIKDGVAKIVEAPFSEYSIVLNDKVTYDEAYAYYCYYAPEKPINVPHDLRAANGRPALCGADIAKPIIESVNDCGTGNDEVTGAPMVDVWQVILFHNNNIEFIKSYVALLVERNKALTIDTEHFFYYDDKLYSSQHIVEEMERARRQESEKFFMTAAWSYRYLSEMIEDMIRGKEMEVLEAEEHIGIVLRDKDGSTINFSPSVYSACIGRGFNVKDYLLHE